MPYRAKHQCNYPGCKKLTNQTYCEEHRKVKESDKDRYRKNSTERGYNSVWRKNRKQFLKEHPLCDMCYKERRLVPATVVHHIIDHKGDQKLFWDSENNWQPLCKRCHDSIKHSEGKND